MLILIFLNKFLLNVIMRKRKKE